MEHLKHCVYCGVEFTASRRDARYCSDRCRAATARKRTAPDALHDDLVQARASIDRVLELLNERINKA